MKWILVAIVFACFMVTIYAIITHEPHYTHYLVTYEATLKEGGWTHGNWRFKTTRLNDTAIDFVRDSIRKSRTDILDAGCIISVVKLEE